MGAKPIDGRSAAGVEACFVGVEMASEDLDHLDGRRLGRYFHSGAGRCEPVIGCNDEEQGGPHLTETVDGAFAGEFRDTTNQEFVPSIRPARPQADPARRHPGRAPVPRHRRWGSPGMRA
jgi:hypothetical protein